MQLNLAAFFSTNADHAQEARALQFFQELGEQGNCRVQICCVPDFTTGPNMGSPFWSNPNVCQVPGTLVRSAKTVLKAVISEPLRDRMRLFPSRRWEAKFKGQPTASVFGAICKQGKWSRGSEVDFFLDAGAMIRPSSDHTSKLSPVSCGPFPAFPY
jgi:hypothetical protein